MRDVASVLRVFAQLESQISKQVEGVLENEIVKPTFMNARWVGQCEEIFKACLAAGREGHLGQHKGATAEGGR